MMLNSAGKHMLYVIVPSVLEFLAYDTEVDRFFSPTQSFSVIAFDLDK